ncbi:facilitated trehalose transporter Tret1-like [Thrips palmi]|uniref:Facilitated trehalose transporter Tret1-like n=1 Tax=Thrips palmi TaxID=161013 RepID=A0A6P8ZTC3_THRPL|nr:facilitated trehalose transporter Tret1-like [Thrips palmi]
MSLGWTSAAAAVEFGAQGFVLTTEEWSWVGAALTLGAMVGSLLVGVLLRPLGPRTECLGLAPIFCAGWALHAWATNVWMLVLGRTLVGLCFGATCVLVPIFTSEVGESAVRGALGSYVELFVCIGVLVVYLLGAYLPLLWLNVCCLAVPVAFALLFVWLPDSPRWLLGRPGRREEARQALAFYRGLDPLDLSGVDAELDELEVALKTYAEEARGVSLASAFSSRATRRGMGLAVGAMVLQQVSGIDGVTFYASQLFRDAGTLFVTADEATLVMASAQIVFCLVALLVVDRLGRKMLLMTSAGIMGLCSLAMGFYFYLNRGAARDRTLDWVPVLVSCVYMMGFSVGLGPVAWLYVGEIFPDRVKGVASSVANASNWVCAFLVTKFFPIVNESLGVQVSFWAFGACCLVGVAAVGLLFPETKGKTLDQIQEELSGAKDKLGETDNAGNTARRKYGSFDDSGARKH